MNKANEKQVVATAYRRRASGYNRVLKLFDSFAWFGFNLAAWRRQAVAALHLKPGDTVVDVGCGTGLNFPLLQRAVTAQGKIIGVDLSDKMLAQAQQTIAANGWTNVELVCADAAEYLFPAQVDGVLSTYALILIPDCGQVVENVCAALGENGRFSVLDMAWPNYCPLWWRHVLFFLRAYGVTAETLRRRPWETVQHTMASRLQDYSQQQRWFGFFYLAGGTVSGAAANA